MLTIANLEIKEVTVVEPTEEPAKRTRKKKAESVETVIESETTETIETDVQAEETEDEA